MNDIKIRFTLKNIDTGDIIVPVYDTEMITRRSIHSNYDIIAMDIWTGRTDKNGKLIFNNDTVKHKYRRIWKTDEHVSKVEWDQNWACFYLKDGNGTKHRMRDDIEYEIVKTLEYA